MWLEEKRMSSRWSTLTTWILGFDPVLKEIPKWKYNVFSKLKPWKPSEEVWMFKTETGLWTAGSERTNLGCFSLNWLCPQWRSACCIMDPTLFIMHKNTAAFHPAHNPAGQQPAARSGVWRQSDKNKKMLPTNMSELMITVDSICCNIHRHPSKDFYVEIFIFSYFVDSTETKSKLKLE